MLLSDGTDRILLFAKDIDDRILEISLRSSTGETQLLTEYTYSDNGPLNMAKIYLSGESKSYLQESFTYDANNLMLSYTNYNDEVSEIGYMYEAGSLYPRVEFFTGPDISETSDDVHARAYSIWGDSLAERKDVTARILQEQVYTPIVNGLDIDGYETGDNEIEYLLRPIAGDGAEQYYVVGRSGGCSSCKGAKGSAVNYSYKNRTQPALTETVVGEHIIAKDTRYGYIDGSLHSFEQGEDRVDSATGFLKVKDAPYFPVQERIYHDGIEVARTSFIYGILEGSDDLKESYLYSGQPPIYRTEENFQTGEKLEWAYDYDPNSGKTIQSTSFGFTHNPEFEDIVYEQTYLYDDEKMIQSTNNNLVTVYSYHSTGTNAGFLFQKKEYINDSVYLRTLYSEYDAFGRAGLVSDTNNILTYYVYDTQGRLISKKMPSPGLLQEYNIQGNMKETIVSLKSGSQYTSLYREAEYYNGDGNPILKVLADGTQERRVFDSYGRVVYEAIIFDGVTIPTYFKQYEYDREGQMTAEILPALYFPDGSSTTSYTYDEAGNVSGITDGNGHTTLKEYDLFGNLTKIDTPDSDNNVYMEYDISGRPTRYAIGPDQDTNIYYMSFYYNGHGEPIMLFNPDSGLVVIDRYWGDNQTLITEKTQYYNTIKTITDALKRITYESYNEDEATISYTYDHSAGNHSIGRLYNVTVNKESIPVFDAKFDYTEDGRIESQVSNFAYHEWETNWNYRADGAEDSTTYPTGTLVTWSPAADPLGRPTHITLNKNGHDIDLATLEYMPGDGPLSGIVFPSNDAAERHQYDPAYRTTAITQTTGSVQTNISLTYQYDGAGNILVKNDLLQPVNTYEYQYDEANRLTEALFNNHSDGFIYVYGDDGLGNRHMLYDRGESYYYVYANELSDENASPNRLRFIYDQHGDVVHEYRYEAGYGRVNWHDGDELAYDARGRLVSYTKCGETQATTYEYDHLGRRIKKRLPGGWEVLYHYDQEGRLLAETTPAGNVIAEYVWVGYRPVALIVPTNPPGDDDDDDDNDDNDNDDDDNNDNNDNNDDDNDDSSPGDDDDDDDSCSCGGSHFELRYRPSFLVRSAEAADREERDFVVYAIHTDHLGTPIAMTNEAGQIAWTMRLSPFGRVLELNEDADGDGTAVTLNLRFPGQYYDEESGLHYNWHRYYDPINGLFSRLDPLFYQHPEIAFGTGASLYSYAINNPLNLIDFTGQDPPILGVPINIACTLIYTWAEARDCCCFGCEASSCPECAMECIIAAHAPRGVPLSFGMKEACCVAAVAAAKSYCSDHNLCECKDWSYSDCMFGQ